MAKDTYRVMFLAALVVLAMLFSSCHAQDDDYCHAIVPCDETTCLEYCQKQGFNNPKTYCKPGQYYPICCCRRQSITSSKDVLISK